MTDRSSALDSSPPRHAPLEMLRQRAQLLQRLREFFHERGFWEVETPLLSADTVVDRHLDPFPVTLFSDPTSPQRGPTFWLQTSPEFGMKRLLAQGADKIFQVTRAFRAGERGRLHNPEFTIVEWYRVGDDLMKGMDLLSELAVQLLQCATPERLSFGEAFQRFVQVDPHRATLDQLKRAAHSNGLTGLPESDEHDRDDWLNLLLSEWIEPQLGNRCPLLLFDYPASQAALARIRRQDPPVAERFELYVNGVEVANGYHELTDSEELRSRNAQVNRLRVKDGKARLPENSRLLSVMHDPGLPACCGVALGFDRLVMTALGAASIDQVMAFPIDTA